MEKFNDELNKRINDNDICFLFWFIYYLKYPKEDEKEASKFSEEESKLIQKILKEVQQFSKEKKNLKGINYWEIMGRIGTLISIGKFVWETINTLFFSLHFQRIIKISTIDFMKINQIDHSELTDDEISKAINFANSQVGVCKFNL